MASVREVYNALSDLANKDEKTLHARQTPCIDDHQLNQEDFTTKGTLEPIASRIVLKIL